MVIHVLLCNTELKFERNINGVKKMKKIKYFLVSALTMCTVLGLCACGSDDKDDNKATESTTTKKEVVTTEATTEEITTTSEDDEKAHYSVKVVDEEGNPIVGAMVQLCNESCFPSVTNAEGVAEFSLDEAEYKASFLTLPEGYAYVGEETAFYFEDGSNELTITLKKES